MLFGQRECAALWMPPPFCALELPVSVALSTVAVPALVKPPPSRAA